MEKQKAALQRAVSWNDVFSTADQRKKITDTKDQVLEVNIFNTHLGWKWGTLEVDADLIY